MIYRFPTALDKYPAIRKIAAYAVLSFILGLNLFAETPTGNIAVYATDSEGAVVAGASAKATNQDTGSSGNCVTGEKDGSCIIAELPAAAYKVEVTAPGFKTFIATNVKVEVSKTTRLEASMQAGPINEQVEVTSEIVSVEAGTLVLLAPGVARLSSLTQPKLGVRANNSASSSTTGSLSVNGSRPHTNGYLLDGTFINDVYSQKGVSIQDDAGIGEILPADALGEATILTNYGAEYGNYSGSIVNASTTGGTNDFHGGIFAVLSNDAFNARDPFNLVTPKNELRYNDFGGNFGGPLKHNKIFGFVAYEGQRQRFQTSTLAPVPTISDFTAAIAALGGDPSIPIPQNPAVNPVIRELFLACQITSKCPGGAALWPLPTPGLPGSVLNSSTSALSQRRLDTGFGRLDVNPSSKDSVSAYYDFADNSQVSPITLDGTDLLPQTNTRERLHTHLASVSYSRTFTSSYLNSLHVSWHQYSSASLDADEAGILDPNHSIGLNTGVRNPQDFGLPQFRIRGLATLGSSPFANPLGKSETDWQLAENGVWTHGLHAFKFGLDFDHNEIQSFDDVNFRGLLEFDSLADFLAGRILRGSISTGDTRRSTSQISNALYFEDSFRWTPVLTVHLGIRWEYFGTPHENQNLLSKYSPSMGLINPASIYSAALDNFAPRLALSWSATRTTTLNASAGMFYDTPPRNFLTGQAQFNTFNQGIAYNALPTRPVLMSNSPTAILQVGVPVFPAATFPSDTRDVFSVGNVQAPRVVRYGLEIQQELFPNLFLDVAYTGSQGRRLFRVRDINSPTLPGGPRPLASAASLSIVAPNPPFIVDEVESSAASNFNSLQLTIRQQQPWHRWQNYVFWTWSHSIDNASDGIDWTPNKTLPNDSKQPNLERASSDFDQRHTVSWQSTYEFPYWGTNKWLDRWQLAGSLVLDSGQPYNVNFADEFDTQGAYDFILRPDLVGNPFVGTSTPDRLLNLAAFAVPCTLDGLGTTVSHCLPGTLHFGNLARNAFAGPRFGKFDLGLSKRFRFTERLNLQLRAEALNLTNHPIFASPVFPRYVALASVKGIGLNGHAGAAGVNCNTPAASADCYLSATATPDTVNDVPSSGAGARAIRFSLRLSF